MTAPRLPLRATPRRRRLSGRALLAACLLLAGTAAPAAGQLALRTAPTRDDPPPRAPRAVIHRDTAFVDAIVRIDVNGGPSDVIPALVRDSVLLFPVRQYFDLVGIRLAAFALRDSAVALLEPGAVPLRFRPADHALVRGADSVPHDSLDVTWWDGDLFVTTALLDRLIGTQTIVDWTNLTVLVHNSAHLPVVARARRERRHQNLLARERPAPDALDLQLRTRPVDGAVLSWSFTATSNRAADDRALELGLGAGLLGGSAEVRPVFWSAGGEAGTDLHLGWWRVWSDRDWIRQARLGDIHSGGRRAMLINGAAVTNAPYIRSNEFDVEQYIGDVPAGWEVELYENGRLSGFDEADALGTFRVPLELRYGQNPFELVLYGPAGETVRQKRTIRVPYSRLRAGRFEYTAAAGACRYDPCDAMVSADARYGLSSTVTLQGGWDGFFGYGDRDLWQPYALVTAAPHPAFGLTGELVGNGHVRGAVAYEPLADLRANVSHTRFARSGTVPGAAYTATTTDGTLYWRPTWRRGASYLQGAFVHSTGPTQRRTLERLTGNLRVGDFRYGVGFLNEDARFGTFAQRRFTVDGSVDAILRGPWQWLRLATVRGMVAVDPGTGFSAMRAVLGRPVARWLRVDGGVSWQRLTGMSLELSVSSATPGPRYGTRTRVNATTGTEALVFANGAVAFDPRSHLLRTGDQSDLGRAGLNGLLYRDDNSNGRRDPGEPGLAGVPVTVGGWPTQTDAEGRFAAWGLPAGEVAEVRVDSLGLGDPQLALPARILRVRPAPNAFGSIEIPVAIGAEIAGYVVFRERPVGGIPVILREMNTGAEIRVTTFGDGGFYRAAVPPGEYEVVIPEELLEQLGAFAPPLSIFVPPGTADKRFSDLHLRLEPRQ